MKAIRLFFLALMYLLSTFSICILALALFAFALYLGSPDDYPGSLLIWIANEKVLTILIVLAGFMVSKSVREDGFSQLKKVFDPAFVWFEKL